VSASEKLKALEVRYGTDIADVRDPYYGPEDEYRTALVNALPQIVAVVEAATEMANWLEMQSSNGYGRDLIPIRDFDAALAALEETLENHVKREWVRRPYPLGDWPSEEALS
jgi:hypothetical protein